MTKIKDYSMKYKLQWWWYSHGGKETVENALGALGLGVFFCSMWIIAYLMDPPGM